MNRHSLMRQLVIEEATNLRKYTTQTELKQLSFDKLDTQSRVACIYGQLTGNCDSDRARELMNKSCTRVYGRKNKYMIINSNNWWVATVKDCPVNGPLTEEMKRSYFFSPIEVFIDQPRNKKNGNNEQLIKFIKGEIDILNFK